MSDSHAYAETLAHAERVCADRGERLTPLRRHVLELVARSDGPVKAYDLLDQMKTGPGAAKPPIGCWASGKDACDVVLEGGALAPHSGACLLRIIVVGLSSSGATKPLTSGGTAVLPGSTAATRNPRHRPCGSVSVSRRSPSKASAGICCLTRISPHAKPSLGPRVASRSSLAASRASLRSSERGQGSWSQVPKSDFKAAQM